MEIWKPVVGYEGRYEVSSEGRIASLRFRGNGSRELMKPTPNLACYMVIMLCRKQYRLHCLVLEAFVGPRPEGMQGCHNDNDKTNNRLENLRWDTPKGNIGDRRSYEADANPNAKLSLEEMRAVAMRRLRGERSIDLAKEFGIAPPRVAQLVRKLREEKLA